MRHTPGVVTGTLLAFAASVTAGCGSEKAGPPPTAQSATSTTLSAKDTFDRGSRNYFPGESLAERTKLAAELCASIKANGGSIVAWVTAVTKDPHMLSFTLPSNSLGAFMGLSIIYKCDNPDYLAQVRQGLAGLNVNGAPIHVTPAPATSRP